jgi:tungstate transport system ATP-binding protein
MGTEKVVHILEVFDLLQIYNGKKVLDIPYLSFDPGVIYCLYGPNGAGKTSLFEILTLLKKPVEGRVLFRGKEVYPQGDAMAEFRAGVTLVQQNPVLFDTTVEKNVDYGLRIRKINRATRKRRVSECLQLVGLDGFQKRRARELSGGEAQRVAVARAVSINPAVLLLDEFSANVDRENIGYLEQIVSNINQQYGTSVLFITHYINQAYRLADKVIHLHDGKIVQSPLRNVFRGHVQRVDTKCIFENQNIKLSIVTSKEGNARIAVPSEAISVSKIPLSSSMRNCLKGRITQIVERENQIQLKVAAGETFDVIITYEAFHEMNLNVGVDLYLNFKASSVEIL